MLNVARYDFCYDLDSSHSHRRGSAVACGAVNDLAVVVVGVHDPHYPKLSEMAQADRPLALLAHSVERRHENRHQYSSWLTSTLRFLKLGPGIAQCHRSIDDELVRRAVGIDAEIAQPLELVSLARLGIG